jgi:hypothetical protein
LRCAFAALWALFVASSSIAGDAADGAALGAVAGATAGLAPGEVGALTGCAEASAIFRSVKDASAPGARARRSRREHVVTFGAPALHRALPALIGDASFFGS